MGECLLLFHGPEKTTRVSVRKSLFERPFCRRVCVCCLANDRLGTKPEGMASFRPVHLKKLP
jgi:hypothetical protein